MPLSVTMMLADSAQAVGGKLYILGGGWSISGPGPHPSAIAVYLSFPWDAVDEQQHLLFELVGSDAEPVLLETPEGMRPMRVESIVDLSEAKVHPDVGQGAPVDAVLALNFAPIPLPPGGSYAWRLSVNGETNPAWQLPFRTRALADAGEGAATT